MILAILIRTSVRSRYLPPPLKALIMREPKIARIPFFGDDDLDALVKLQSAKRLSFVMDPDQFDSAL